MDITKADELNDEAVKLHLAGDYVGAEKLHLQALDLKMKSQHSSPSIVATTENNLGEVYLKMGKMDKAEELFKSAHRRRSGNDADLFGKVCTSENLGKLYESQGDIVAAQEWRKSNGENRMICSYFDCPKTKTRTFTKWEELKRCKPCKCAFYCTKECRDMDWGRHKEFCRVMIPEEANVTKYF